MRVWALIACVWLLEAAAPLQAPPGQQPHDRTGGKQGTENSNPIARDDAEATALVAVANALKAVVGPPTPTEEDKAKAAEDRQRDKDQLQADQGSARWAMVAALAALAGLPLSAVGIWLVWGTLRATEAAVSEAGEATEAARKAVAVTEATAHTQLRPYIFQAGVGMDSETHPDHPTVVLGWALKVGWKNYGQTPGRRVKSGINWAIFNESVPPPDFAFPDDPKHNSTVGTAGPQATWHSVTRLPADVAHEAFEAERYLFVWAWCEYDGFPGVGRHRTEFCARLLAEDVRRKDSQWMIQMVERFNGFDDDCDRKPYT